MRIMQMKLQNWRNFGSAEMEIEDRLFIVGANASGKSNLLDVFRFLKDVATFGLQKSIDTRGGIKKIRYLNARNPSFVEISISLRDEKMQDMWSYQLQFNSAGAIPGTYISLEKVVLNGKEEVLNRTAKDPAEDFTSRQFTHLEQPAINTHFRPIFDYFRRLSYVNIIPQLVRERDSFIPSQTKEDYYGRNLIDVISEVSEKTRKARLKKIADVLTLAVPQFSSLEYVVDSKDNRPHLQVNYKHFRPQGAYQREDQFSDGTLRLIGIIWAMMDGEGLLLLEEPELYLHSAIISQLPAFIAKAQIRKNNTKRQIIISSHSREILNSDTIGAEEIALLLPNKEGTKISKANTITEITDLLDAGFTPADAVIPYVTPKTLENEQLSSLYVSSV